jgi:hypothetical protein
MIVGITSRRPELEAGLALPSSGVGPASVVLCSLHLHRPDLIVAYADRIGAEIQADAVQNPQMRGVDDLSAGAFRRASLDGAMFGLTPAPTNRVHNPSGVATHSVASASADEGVMTHS